VQRREAGVERIAGSSCLPDGTRRGRFVMRRQRQCAGRRCRSALLIWRRSRCVAATVRDVQIRVICMSVSSVR